MKDLIDYIIKNKYVILCIAVVVVLYALGVVDFGMGLTLREGDREYYYEALDKSFPGLKEKYISRYGNAYELPSPNAKDLYSVFHKICNDNKIMSTAEECFRYMNDFPDKYRQMSIFDI